VKPQILKKGKIDCVHFEKIVDNIGLCIKCGRKIKYIPYYELTEAKFNPENRKTAPYLVEIETRRGGVVTR
jgi:hypothetical protein